MAFCSGIYSCLFKNLGLHHKRIILTSVRLRKTTRRRLEELSMQKRIKKPLYKNSLSDLQPLTDIIANRDNKTLEDTRQEKLKIYRQYLPPKYNTLLLEALLGADNINNLLITIDSNLADMNSYHLAVAFEAITDQVNLNSADPSTVLVSAEFKKLCYKSLFRMRFFETDEVLKVLDCLTALNIPPKLLIAQCALQMTRYMINDFNMKELRHIDHVLAQMNDPSEEDDNKSLLKTIRKALPIAYKRQLNEKIFVDKDETKKLSLEQIRLLNKS